MQTVIVVPRIHQKGLDILDAEPGIQYEVIEDLSEASLERAFAKADGAIVRALPIKNSVLAQANSLKVVARHGVGYNNLDVDYLTGRGIPLALTVDANAISVAEHTMFMLLTLAKNGLVYDQAARSGDFAKRESLDCHDISGKTLLLLGFGRIGRAVAARARVFGMNVVVHDPLLPADAIAEHGCAAAPDLAAALPEADFLSVHIPYTPETKGVIGAAELALMRPGACVINTARGGIVDEKALTDALVSGRLRGAGLDVFEEEPPATDNPLLKLPNVVLSPHSAGLTVECAERMAIDSAKNVIAGLNGTLNPATVVNRQVLNP